MTSRVQVLCLRKAFVFCRLYFVCSSCCQNCICFQSVRYPTIFFLPLLSQIPFFSRLLSSCVKSTENCTLCVFQHKLSNSIADERPIILSVVCEQNPYQCLKVLLALLLFSSISLFLLLYAFRCNFYSLWLFLSFLFFSCWLYVRLFLTVSLIHTYS